MKDKLERECLVNAVHVVQKHVCAYRSRTFCDCKFGVTSDRVGRGESGSGCPELRTIASLLAIMTEKEYDRLVKRMNKPAKKRK